MDRRNFFKIVSTVSAGAAAVSCDGKRDPLIPLLVADHVIVAGEEQWHPSICTSCAGGCGVIVRVMRDERIIERNGEKFREPIACAKKIEGNPLDPVSGGGLCARGHAALQALYNPDRLHGPMRRTDARGKAIFAPVSWDEGIAGVAEKLREARTTDPSKIVFLSRLQPGSRSASIQGFLQALGAPAARTCSASDLAVERKAAELAFGWKGVPRYDLAAARYTLSVGADFVSSWASPVYYARQLGHFRQGRPGVRGKFVQAESRMSLTAASADEWLPLHPGSEPQLLIAVARLLMDEKLGRNQEQLPAGMRDAIEGANLEGLIRATGVSEKRLRRVTRELGESEAPLVMAGASIVHTNSVEAVLASHYLNVLLGNVGHAGGVLPPHADSAMPVAAGSVVDAVKSARVLLLDGENPVYNYPVAAGVTSALANTGTIVSFGRFVDDSVAYADTILPDHHGLESEAAVVPTVAPQSTAVNVTTTFVRPLYDTRPIEQTLGDIAKKANLTFVAVSAKSFVEPMIKGGETWDEVASQGGLWRDESPKAANVKPLSAKLSWSGAAFSGGTEQFPLQFQPYLSLQYHDGSGANLPWMQELPDPASSAMWDLPAEIDPRTAERLNIATGDRVRIESPHGSLEAWAYVHPAAIPGVLSMGIGEGHAHYGRYATGRGANPLAIVAATWEPSTGALAFGATRVRVTRLESAPGELAQFSPKDREQGPWGYR